MYASSGSRVKVGAAAIAAALVCGGCVVAAAGAGAGGTIYLTGNGAESIVAVSADDALRAAERAFDHFQITRTEFKEESGGTRRELKGKTNDEETDVTVTLEREGDSSTKIGVSARTSFVTWDKEFARDVAEKVVELAGTG